MSPRRHRRNWVVACGLGVAAGTCLVLAQPRSAASSTSVQQTRAIRRWASRFRLRDRDVEDSPASPRSSAVRLDDLGGVRRNDRRAKGMEWSSESGGARCRWPRRALRGTEPAPLQPRIAPVEPQFLEQRIRDAGCPDHRRVPERTRRVLRSGDGEWASDLRSLRHCTDHRGLDSIRAGVFGRRREDVGSELDRGRHAVAVV